MTGVAGEGFALSPIAVVAARSDQERPGNGKDFPKTGKFFPIGTNRDR
jgi:hypothetical protein